MKQSKSFLFLLIILILPPMAKGQNLSTTIKVQAMDLGSALMKNDFETFVKYMHPNVIAYAGGKEKMKAKMDSAYAAAKLFGVSFKRYSIGTPGEIVIYKDQLQTVLPEITTIKTPMGELTVETSMIVISPDGGKNWWFIDTNVYKVEKLKSILPDISPQLVIPPQKQPKLVPVDSTDKN
ncbi:MAG TPA: hypothetical protein VGQ53_13845 [Chitinophagaceae bacterium]|jgi:hypothetical protein|nr:hypothetical protein [Chitinophagaceae bacterium]